MTPQYATLTDDARAVWLAVTKQPGHVMALDCDVHGLALLAALMTLRAYSYILFSLDSLHARALIPLYAANDPAVAGLAEVAG